MKTLIKIIIILFFGILLAVYMLAPSFGYVKDDLMFSIMPWYLAWWIAEHVIFSIALFIIPIIFIFKWIDESMADKTLQDNCMKTNNELKDRIEEGIHVK